MSDILLKTVKEISKLFRNFFLAEQVSQKNNFLQQRDPRVKLVTSFLFIFISVIIESIPLLLIILSFSLSMAIISKIDLRNYFARFFFIPLFSLVVIFPQIFLIQGETLFSLFGLNFSVPGLIYVTEFTLGVTCSISFIALLLMTTDFNKLINSLKSFGLPKTGLSILYTTYRYLFLFFMELHRMLLARENRYLDNGLSLSWRSNRNLLGSFFIKTIERGERVSLVMEARGGEKIMEKNSSLDKKDIIYLSFSIAFVSLIGVLEWKKIVP